MVYNVFMLQSLNHIVNSACNIGRELAHLVRAAVKTWLDDLY